MKTTQKKENLSGYRLPTLWEKERIIAYLERDFRLARHGSVISIGCMICIVASFLLSLYQEIVEGREVSKGMIPEVIIGITAGCVGVVIMKGFLRKKALWKRICQGQFEVLDCVGERFNGHIRRVNKGIVYIRTYSGEVCEDKFFVDVLTAYEGEKQQSIPFLLMRQKEYQFYELMRITQSY